MNITSRVIYVSVLLLCVVALAHCKRKSDPVLYTPPPEAPQNLIATAGLQKVELTWDAVTNASIYYIYYVKSPLSTQSGMGMLTSAVTTTAQHLHLSGGTYHYTVTAVVNSIESGPSNVASAGINLVSFTTSTMGSGDLSTWPDAVSAGAKTGLAAGDAICQSRAEAAGLAGIFKAWISDDSDDAYCRMHGLTGKLSLNCGLNSLPTNAGPWVRTDGAPFADVISVLTASTAVLTPAVYTENGTQSNYGYMHSGTWSQGVGQVGSTCNNWTSGSASDHEMVGSIRSTYRALFWTSSPCSNTFPLLCMELGSGPPLNKNATGKKAFLSSASGPGNLSSWPAATDTGAAAGDAICTKLAANSGLTGTFKAWLSDGSVNAIDRIASNGPWVRLDGIKVSDSKQDLTDDALFTTINLTEQGTYGNMTGAVWTGTTQSGLKTVNNCNSWTDGTAGSTGTTGVLSWFDRYWSNNAITQCDSVGYLYCLEDE